VTVAGDIYSGQIRGQAPGILSRYEDEATPPSTDHSSDYRLEWCMTAMLEGEQYLRNQPLYERHAEVREYLLGFKNTMRGALGLSDIQVSELWRIYQLLGADWTDIDPIWRFASENHRWQRQSRILSKLSTINYIKSGSDGQVNLMCRQSLESGSGVLAVLWNRQTRDLGLFNRNPDDVLPIRPISPDSYQGALAVCDRRETTVNWAKAAFPRYAQYIIADRDASMTGLGMRHRDMIRRKMAGSVSAFEIVDMQEALPTERLGAMPVVDLFYMYIEDPCRNESSHNILMGDWDIDPSGRAFARNYWSYIVEPGAPKYPNKRLIIFTRKCVLYDGPSTYWHGMFPYVKFTPDPFPGLWYGISPLFACLPLQYEIDRIYRALSDHIQKILRPPVYGDKNSISDPELKKIDPRQPGQRWRQNPQGKGVQIAEIPQMDPMVERHLDRLRDRMEDIAGVKSVVAAMDMAKAAQVPADSTFDKMKMMTSGMNRSRSRQLERAQIEVGSMQSYNFAEFYDERRRFAAFAEDGITVEDYDFDPDSLIPAYTNGDFRDDGRPHDHLIMDPRPRMDRARDFMRPFSLLVKPGTLMESANQNRKLMVMMARASGDCDLYTYLDEMGFEDIGPEPDSNMYERVLAEKYAMAQAAAMPPAPPPGSGGGDGSSGGGDGGGAGPSTGPSTPEGRPHTFQKDPHIEGANSGRPKNSTS
jgi:hypothetical protein